MVITQRRLLCFYTQPSVNLAHDYPHFLADSGALITAAPVRELHPSRTRGVKHVKLVRAVVHELPSVLGVYRRAEVIDM